MRSGWRLAVTAGVGLAVAVLTGLLGAWRYAALVGWDATAATFSGWVWAAIAPMSPKQTADHCGREDPGQAQADALVLLASVASLLAVGVVLVAANSAHGSARWLLAGLAAGSVGLSWLLAHTLFTLRYARIYHSSGGGVDFNQTGPPRYMDFAYLAFTIGMTFQVSDTSIKASSIRGAALRHALLSYLFGAVILATTVNFIVSLSSSGGG